MDVATRKPSKKMEPDDLHQVIVRMPHKTWEQLDADAKANFRTINMHILWLIQERLSSVEPPADSSD